MKRRLRQLIGATLVGVGLLWSAPTLLFAQATMPNSEEFSHEQMYQMMDTIHGPGAGEWMYEAMVQVMGMSAEQVEELMDQCVAMTGTMQNVESMMGSGMPGMMGGMPGMMGGQTSQSRPGMMRGMMGW